jgi:hypothetical protein
MKLKKGSISIEAVISLSTLILFFSFLIQALLFYGFHDQTAQTIYDEIDSLSHYNYIYESVGIFNMADYPAFESEIPAEIKPLITKGIQAIDGQGKEVFLKSVLKKQLEKIVHSKVKDFKIIDFDLESDYLSVKVSYLQALPFGIEIPGYVQIDKQLWFLGSHPELINMKTLSSMLKENQEEQSNLYVYITKTGSKYHLEDCFYITRSTTDHKAVKKVILKDAEKNYGLTPCKRCILKGWSLWN